MTVFGTVGSAGLAAYFGVLQPRIARPLLTLEQPKWETQTLTNLPTGTTGNACWMRVPVFNKSRTVLASDVKAAVISITDADQPTGAPYDGLAGFELSWTSDDPAMQIPPRARRYLNIGFAFDAGTALPSFVLALKSHGASGRESRPEQRMRLAIELTANNGKAFQHELVIDPSGLSFS